MRTLDEYLPEHPFFAGMDPDQVVRIAGCAETVHVPRGELLFRNGDPADGFYLVRLGQIAVGMRAPDGEYVALHTAGPGDVVGWSWLVPGYHWLFDAYATTESSVVRLSAICLKHRCDEDPALGYALLQRVANGLYTRMQDARQRLLDLHASRELAG